MPTIVTSASTPPMTVPMISDVPKLDEPADDIFKNLQTKNTVQTVTFYIRSEIGFFCLSRIKTNKKQKRKKRKHLLLLSLYH